ncbi:MAG TPA: phage tail protein [Sphingomonas sp.]
MATLVLGAVGGLVGGPLGAALGSVLGRAADARLLAPKRREGPRLSELKVQTSSYGTQIPKVWGTMRVAGTVFWATDIVENRASERPAKGAPKVTTYSYSASFAVLLSARPVLSVGRVWADGKLVRGAAGDWKVRTGFRLHRGGEDQAPDPLIASAEGADCPAQRGCAYAVFEGLELAEFGNRIPSLTFEVVADPGPVAVGAIAEALADEVDAGAPATLDGFAATGGSVRAVLELLMLAGEAEAACEGGRIAIRATPARTVAVEDGTGGAARRRRIAPADAGPRVVTVAHYDPARDGQAGVQRAGRGPGREERIELAAAIGAGRAKSLAAAALARAEAARTRRTVSVGLDGLAVRPGDAVAIAGETGRWRVLSVETERMATALELQPIEPETLPAVASAGRALPSPDRLVGVTRLHAFEPPGLDEPLSRPRLLVAAGGGPGWRGAGLLYSLDDGASWIEAGGTAPSAIVGAVGAVPGRASAGLRDLKGTVIVDLPAHATLADADDRMLDAGANLALVGDELLQFGRAEPLSPTRWRLSRLLRGRRGTEAAIGTAAAGAPFVLMDGAGLRAIDLPASAMGREVRVLASGVGDGAGPAEARALVTGASVLPPSPVRLRVETLADGNAVVTWIRRSRAGWSWIDGTDAPLAEEREAYQATVVAADGTARVVELDAPALRLTAGERVGGKLTVTVRQRGSWGTGAPATIGVPAV